MPMVEARTEHRPNVTDRDWTIPGSGANGPEHQALLQLIGTLVGER
jgi:hypothetical protein